MQLRRRVLGRSIDGIALEFHRRRHLGIRGTTARCVGAPSKASLSRSTAGVASELRRGARPVLQHRRHCIGAPSAATSGHPVHNIALHWISIRRRGPGVATSVALHWSSADGDIWASRSQQYVVLELHRWGGPGSQHRGCCIGAMSAVRPGLQHWRCCIGLHWRRYLGHGKVGRCHRRWLGEGGGETTTLIDGDPKKTRVGR